MIVNQFLLTTGQTEIRRDKDKMEEEREDHKIQAGSAKTDSSSKAGGASHRPARTVRTSDAKDINITSDILIARKREDETDEEFLNRVVMIDGELFDLLDNTYEVK